MSVSILEVLEQAGYDPIHDLEDARWLLSQSKEFDEILDKANELDERFDDYEDYIMIQEDDFCNYDNPTFEEWVKETSDA